jgi:ribosomal protein S16
MADVGKKTGKQTQAGRDVYETAEGEMVSEKSTTIEYKGKWINVPTIHGGKQYSENQLIEMLDEGLIEPTSMHNELEEAIEAAQRRSNSLEFSKGGTTMKDQMELFEEGGLKDEGGMIDEESGNEVPVGGTRKGVRDDIPANISEGEFIFPEDVTRYIGLDKLMRLRQEAKMGLKRMEAMGQMGNSDEAIIDDDLPFDMADLIIVSGPEGDDTELDMAVGGVTMQPNQVRRLGGAPSTDISNVSAPTTTPLTSQSAGVRRLTPEPTNEGVATPTFSFKELMGDAYLEMFEYRNEAGEVLMVPHLDGKPVYEVPPGYTIYNPATETEGAEGSVVANDEEAATVVEALAAVNSDKERPTTEPPKPPVDWDNLSTQDFINEAAGLTGMSRTIANGVTLFMGPLGFIASAMMKYQDKNVIAKIDARLAAGGLTRAEIAELKKIRSSLEKTSGGLLGKVIETVGNFFNKDKETIEAIKVQAEKIDANAAKVAAQQTEIEKIMSSLSEEDKNIIAQGNADSITDVALANKITEEARKAATTITQEDVANIVGGKNVADVTDAIREGVSQLTPIGEVATQAPDRTFRDMTQTAPNFEASVVAPTVSPEEVVMSQPVTSAMSPEEVVMSQPVVSSAISQTKDSLTPKVVTTPIVPVDNTVNQQTEAAFQPTVVKTTGTGAGRDFADMPVTGEQIAYASAAESKDQPYDPRNITRVPSEQVTNIPVTAEVQTNVSGMTSPSTETGTGMSTPTSDTFYRPAEPSKLAPSGTFVSKPDTYNSTIAPVSESVGTVPEVKQTQDTFGEDYTPTSAELNKQLADAGQVNLTTIPDPRVDTSTLAGIAAASGTPSTDITTTAPAAKQTFSDAFAANRAAGKDTFTFEGKSYTTQTKEEATTAATPAGSNNLYESVANFLTPNDGKEYVGGVLVDSSTKKPIVKESKDTTVSKPATTTVAKTTKEGKTIIPTGTTIATGTKLNSKSDPVVIVDGKAYNESKAPSSSSSKKSSSSSTKTTTTTKSKEAVQKEINKALKESGGEWTSELNTLVKERDAAKPAATTTTTKSSNNDSGGGGSSSSSSSGGGCCFIMLEARYGDGTMDEVVRRYRDEYMTDRNRRGYYKVAEVLVPLMRKSSVVKWLVTKTFADPLVSYGKYYYGQNKHGVIYSPVKSLWMKLFDTVGGDTEFIRENGEVV